MVDTEIGVDDRDDENEVVSTDNIDYIDDDDEDASWDVAIGRISCKLLSQRYFVCVSSQILESFDHFCY